MAFRQLALEHHPDQFKKDSHPGTEIDEGLERFLEIKDAYDFLVSEAEDRKTAHEAQPG